LHFFLRVRIIRNSISIKHSAKGAFAMLQKLQKRKQSGFTIIEVLIVLAIAGLILLVVFLAVPALQRNSRNTQRKADVSALLGALSEYVNNNAGQLPTTAAQVTGNAKLGFYTAAEVNLGTSGGTDVDEIYIATGNRCNGNALTTTGATARNVAALYYIETSSSTTAQCQES
jgi:prepilin-type N-terminal cleavage/methylation domain-containing protein